jgi:hypothetical protein
MTVYPCEKIVALACPCHRLHLQLWIQAQRGVGKFFWTGWDMVEGEMMFTPELDIMT